jgi:hypothetical protein
MPRTSSSAARANPWRWMHGKIRDPELALPDSLPKIPAAWAFDAVEARVQGEPLPPTGCRLSPAEVLARVDRRANATVRAIFYPAPSAIVRRDRCRPHRAPRARRPACKRVRGSARASRAGPSDPDPDPPGAGEKPGDPDVNVLVPAAVA